MKYFYIYEYKICNLKKQLSLGIIEENESICRICFDTKELSVNFKKTETPLIKNTAQQLDEYFNKKRKIFDIPIKLNGTDFQKKVWNTLLKIKYSEKRSYGEIAAMSGNPKACRAVGMANNRNPIVIIVPCHRVISSDGSLTGYAGGLELKQALLELEAEN